MLDSYRRVLAVPGALRFSLAALVGRMPIAMIGIGIVLLVQARTGSYGYAGAVAGSFVVAQAAAAVAQGRFTDARGQAPVLTAAAAGYGTGLGVLVAGVQAGWPAWAVHAAALASGACLPQVGSAVRARWSHVLDEPAAVQTAYALESVLDEVVFMVGPVVVTGLAAVWDPVAGLGAAIVLGVLGTWWLAAQRETAPAASRPRDRTTAVSMPWGVVLALAATSASLGALFGASEVATVAFAEEQGRPAAAGWLLAGWALGSMVAGVVTGALAWPEPLRDPRTRLRWGAAAMAAAMVAPTLVGSLTPLAVALLVGGLAIAPTLIATFTIVEQAVPRARLTEGMSVLHTGLVAGVAPGAAVAGWVVDQHGASAGYLVALVSGVVGAVVAQAARRAGR